jgi:DNA-binding response OmpR family regulator
VRLLERGGDDVIVKPFSYPELRARIAAVLRRTMPRQPRPVLSAGPVRIDLRDRRVTVDERAVELSAVEYRLLCHLAAEPSRVFAAKESSGTAGAYERFVAVGVVSFEHAGRRALIPSAACRARVASQVSCA